MFGASEDQIRSADEPSIDEINALIPRRVRLDPDQGYSSLVFALILIGVGVVWFGGYSYYCILQSRHKEALKGSGREAIATITKISGRRTNYVYYTFRLDDAEYEGNVELDYEPEFTNGRFSNAYIGKKIPVLYLPSEPNINHPVDWVWWTWWDLIPQLSMLPLPIGGVYLLGYLYWERRLACIGWVTEGRVIACAPNGKRFRVDYEFSTPDGAEFDGADEYSDEYATGSTIRVIYLKSNPKRNEAYPMTIYETVELEDR